MSQVLPPIVTQWLERISNRDAIGAADCFTHDAVYYFAMPHPPVQGRDHIRGMFSGQATMYKRISWEVTESAVDGDRVWMERLDRFFTHDDREIFIECVGVVELEDGLISEVRDYVDLHTWEERNK
ncbi:limonene-1,2-epoxide hydrolase family protein [Kineosporia mesophila]|uniref:Limonene-1,2-epoxide hydrolase family protein n=1 Tax=Kineosporia mesophila TaxID=566012 RepID=A0ABP7AVN9_9ACTN|nr:nuclear transport factor 2 family protein [Kineosporia mesophila]MCD5354142.1 nuclear transport factor 2 family protein [Kineosporia mesophila]